MSDNLTISAELVPCVRRGLHLSLAGVCEVLGDAAAEHWALVEDEPTAALSTAYAGGLKHLDRIRALLDAVGWDAEQGPRAVVIDLDQHCDALYGAASIEVGDFRPESRALAEVYAGLLGLRETLDARIAVTA